MSTIEKLSIQGVRSFGANSEDLQSITFSSPLSLILGENGCGKTTIIECLKYAMTGDVPPGSDHGKYFVHDPKIFNLSDTLAQIKLQVRDKRGARLSVCRSMKIANRRDKSTFETLDATLTYVNDVDGNMSKPSTESVSRRCADVDAAMCDFMGVSKTIINNVLFCHQEDSSWPLDGGKKLKEKFDAIFGITQYNKAVEKILKMRKEEMASLKVMEGDLRFCAHLKLEMEDKLMNKQRAEQKCEAMQQQRKDCDADMKPIDARLLEIRKIEYEVGECQAQKVELDTKLKNCREQISSLGKKLKKHFAGDLNQLDEEIQAFGRRMQEKKLMWKNVEECLARSKAEERGVQKSLAELDKSRCLTEEQRKKEHESNQKFYNSIRTLGTQLNLSMNSNLSEKPENVIDVLDDIQCMLLSKHAEVTEQTAKFDNEDQIKQHEIDTLRVEITKTEEGVVAQQKQRDTFEREKETLGIKINNIELSLKQLSALTKQIEDTNKMYEKTIENFKQDELRETISIGKVNVMALQSEFETYDKKLTFLNSISKLMAEISLKNKEIEKKEQEIRRVNSKHSDNFSKIFTETVTRNYRRTVQATYEKLRRDVKDLTDKANAQKLKQQSFEIKRKSLKENIIRMEKDLEESKEVIFEKCHSTPYEDLIVKTKAAVTKYQLDHGAVKSAEAIYKKYMQKIDDEPCCPLCHKSMNQNEIIDLSSELADEIQKLPDNIIRTENLLKSAQLKYETLLQIKPTIEKKENFEREIPKQREELKKLEVELAETVNQYESLQLLLVEPALNMDLANAMLSDMALLDEAIKEVARIKTEVNDLTLKLPHDHDSGTSIEALQTEKDNVAKELEIERKNVENDQQTYEKQMEALNRLRETKNQLKDKEIKLQEGLQSLPQLQERQTELGLLLANVIAELAELKTKIKPLQQKLNAVVAEKARLKNQNRAKIAELQQKLDSYRSADKEIHRLQNEVFDYKKLNLETVLEDLKDSIQTTKENLKKLLKDIKNNEEKLDAIKTDCLNQESLERDLKDNRELKVLQQKEIELKEQNSTLSKQLFDYEFGKLTKEKNELIAKRDEATVRKGELLGQIGATNCQIMRINAELEEPKYKDSVKNFRRINYEVIVTQRLIDDLGQYRVALECSLMRFHNERMEKINRLIREYWRLIYRGNDIDYIQIKTDDKTNDKSGERRRSYNYQVIQSKNNSEIEMRGRCSAGQRVLASLIIRMALAETFSSNCGVLALDEPTTNLDRCNIISLCEALNRIVEERQSQFNFMLIIITHDEEFVSMLGKINSYHKVFRNDECKSVIRLCKT